MGTGDEECVRAADQPGMLRAEHGALFSRRRSARPRCRRPRSLLRLAARLLLAALYVLAAVAEDLAHVHRDPLRRAPAGAAHPDAGAGPRLARQDPDAPARGL